MSDTCSLLEQSSEHVLQSTLETAFQSADIAPKFAAPAPPAPISLSDAPAITSEVTEGSEAVEEDSWKGEYEAQVEEWRAQSAEARAKAERERARWEQIRKREAEERQALGQEPENWDALGSHITSSFAAASEVLASSSPSLASTSLVDSEHLVSEHKGPSSQAHASQHLKTDTGSPSQKWEHIDSSPTSSYPSMSFPETSIPSSPSPPNVAFQQTTGRDQPQKQPSAERKPSNVPPSTIPSLLDGAIAPRTRMTLLLTSLAINLFLPFVNGVMLGFGEIFAKNVLVGWMGWKSQSGRTAAKVGVRR
ncbi:hypothetical protein CY34DRAFT_802029 [Suillus luteus UH-Slu-Lm8-n1]|uniref:Mitochondrial import protein 1 n=1 Tax=Suillus luteus UH-Slu-Lm8-n1 TaxID=930992 RepID=A0A0D0ATQ6_9AGAM|nr:hypothetical protein CY34DRAFT_802029 [Suillus luteus UH-Slu-Lm8-n1]